MQQPGYNDTPKFIDTLGDIFENASELPEDLRERSNQITEWWIQQSEAFNQEKEYTLDQVEQNVRNNAVAGYGEQAATFLSQPANLVISFLGLIGLILLFKRL